MLRLRGLRARSASAIFVFIATPALWSCGKNGDEAVILPRKVSPAASGNRTPLESRENGIMIGVKKPDASDPASTDLTAWKSTIPEAAPPFDLSELDQLTSPPPAIENPNPLPEPRPADTPPLVQVYLALRAGHQFFSGDAQEGANAGFVSQGKVFSVYSYRLEGMVKLYRCYSRSNDRHFVTLEKECVEKFNGAEEGAYGYISTSQNPEESALFRCFNTQTSKYTTTLDAVEQCDVKASTITTLGYVR